MHRASETLVVDPQKTSAGDPPQVMGLVWNPYAGASLDPTAPRMHDFVVFGANYIQFCALDPETLEFTRTEPSAGACEVQTFHHACFLPTGHVLTAGANGKLALWFGNVKDGVQGLQEVEVHMGRCRAVQRLASDNPNAPGQIVTGGADGRVKLWQLSDALPTVIPDEKAALANPPLVETASFDPACTPPSAVPQDVGEWGAGGGGAEIVALAPHYEAGVAQILVGSAVGVMHRRLPSCCMIIGPSRARPARRRAVR